MNRRVRSRPFITLARTSVRKRRALIRCRAGFVLRSAARIACIGAKRGACCESKEGGAAIVPGFLRSGMFALERVEQSTHEQIDRQRVRNGGDHQYPERLVFQAGKICAF